jgi:hypothetical protein
VGYGLSGLKANFVDLKYLDFFHVFATTHPGAQREKQHWGFCLRPILGAAHTIVSQENPDRQGVSAIITFRALPKNESNSPPHNYPDFDCRFSYFGCSCSSTKFDSTANGVSVSQWHHS